MDEHSGTVGSAIAFAGALVMGVIEQAGDALAVAFGDYGSQVADFAPLAL